MTSGALPSLRLSLTDDISTVAPDEWNRLAHRDEYSPFLEHEFLLSVERSRCACPETGWHPRHFLLRDSRKLIAAAPAYIKTHSMGEFVFDQGLAQAAEAMGKAYYPKLVATLPFTPAPGYRFLIDPDYSGENVGKILLEGMKELRTRGGLGSSSILFADPYWDFRPEGYLGWAHQYFLWENAGYSVFQDYLARFSKNQRRNIIRERQSVAAFDIRVLTGEEITPDLMDLMYDYYRSTNENFGPWAAFFLNREWFNQIGRDWKHRVVLFGAWMSGGTAPVALSMAVRKKGLMVGRYWGAATFVKNLHFELCYYAPVEYAIREGIRFFDPGMGSPHKARRGFGSREFNSYHDFSDPEIARLFRDVLPEANATERESIQYLDLSVPWKKFPPAG